jgi:hypothetical protein
MHSAGWGVEVISWDGSCRPALRTWARTNGTFIRLDDYYDAITFLKDGRWAKPLDLSKRPMSATKATAKQRQVQSLKEDYEKQLATMVAAMEVEKAAGKAMADAKERNLAKYEKRMERRRK